MFDLNCPPYSALCTFFHWNIFSIFVPTTVDVQLLFSKNNVPHYRLLASFSHNRHLFLQNKSILAVVPSTSYVNFSLGFQGKFCQYWSLFPVHVTVCHYWPLFQEQVPLFPVQIISNLSAVPSKNCVSSGRCS